MGSPPPGGPGLHQTPPKTYSQAVSLESKALDDQLSKAVRFSPVADVHGSVASVDLPEELLVNSKPLWSAYIVGHFMGDAPHIGKVCAIVNRICPKTVLFRIDNPQLKARVLKRNFWHIADIPIVVQEWSPKTASARPDLTAVPLWVDLTGVPDHLFSQNGLTFFGDTIGRTVKLHPNTERCVRLDVARLLVVMNLEKPLPTTNTVRGSGETLSVSYPWLPPRCLGCKQWGHTDKNCTKNKKSKDIENASNTRPVAEEEVVKENTMAIDMVEPVMEGTKLDIGETIAQGSSTKEEVGTKTMPEYGEPDIVLTQKSSANADNTENEDWLTIPQSKSPSLARNRGRVGRILRWISLLARHLDTACLVMSWKRHLNRILQKSKQKSGKNKKTQKNKPNTNVGTKKDQNKGAKNKPTNQASSRRH
ncbi:hypothetical protein Bca4012_020878 [Brassica carinata]|uniref:DUF4283 domain-containing protein n=1 Tax=Brassica carinata TaxID=52824 RepID=A0A8X7WEV4_BRACI|nr:hypothetical protein Bca52824_000748 [Brassica carinata]